MIYTYGFDPDRGGRRRARRRVRYGVRRSAAAERAVWAVVDADEPERVLAACWTRWGARRLAGRWAAADRAAAAVERVG